jgi:hypothetical protein
MQKVFRLSTWSLFLFEVVFFWFFFCYPVLSILHLFTPFSFISFSLFSPYDNKKEAIMSTVWKRVQRSRVGILPGNLQLGVENRRDPGLHAFDNSSTQSMDQL